jgi:hypothetical protein
LLTSGKARDIARRANSRTGHQKNKVAQSATLSFFAAVSLIDTAFA